jgi:hypothetical protein
MGVMVPTRGVWDFWAKHLDCGERQCLVRTCMMRRACDKRAVVGLRMRKEGAIMPAAREGSSEDFTPSLGYLESHVVGGVREA